LKILTLLFKAHKESTDMIKKNKKKTKIAVEKRIIPYCGCYGENIFIFIEMTDEKRIERAPAAEYFGDRQFC